MFLNYLYNAIGNIPFPKPNCYLNKNNPLYCINFIKTYQIRRLYQILLFQLVRLRIKLNLVEYLYTELICLENHIIYVRILKKENRIHHRFNYHPFY